MFTYDGIISVGVDLSDVSCSVENEAKRIVLTLPEPRILSSEIDEDSFAFPYVSDSIFNATGMADYIQLIGMLEKEKAAELLENRDFMQTAQRNTEDVLRSFLMISELTKDYELVFR